LYKLKFNLTHHNNNSNNYTYHQRGDQKKDLILVCR
jgi:hypothetical protein